MLKPYYIRDILGDYAGELRESQPRADGVRHVDTPGMIQSLRELNVNTYLYLIWHEKTDWDDLRKEFLPAAKQAGIDVWVYLVPPANPPPNDRNHTVRIISPGQMRSVVSPANTIT